MPQHVDKSDILAGSKKLIWCAAYADRVLLIPDDLMEELLAVRHALKTAHNWQGFLDLLLSNAKEQMQEFFAVDERFTDKKPAEVPFDQEQIAWIGDGDWPVWPEQQMLDWVPEIIQQKYGKCESSTLNGDFLDIPESCLEAVMADLDLMGYHCVLDEQRVLEARGLL